MKKYLSVILLAVFFSCTGTGAEQQEDFETFNQKFHSDTVFQLSRIAFPIGGRYADGDDAYTWTKENWPYLKVPVKEKVKDSEYRHVCEKTNSTVMEKYWIDSSGFKVERRFKLIKGKWFLTYYDDFNL